MKPKNELKRKLKAALTKSRNSFEETGISTKRGKTTNESMKRPAKAKAPVAHRPVKLSALQTKMQSKLSGSKFRMINESLYTTPSNESLRLFGETPELFEVYHCGFAAQVAQWPVNPLDLITARIITSLKERLTCQKDKEIVIADMGCGEAGLAKSLQLQEYQIPRIKVHSFDLVAGNEFITACDIAHVPLEGESVDIVVFCLALMGTNFADFLREAQRILKERGELRIAEVVSRIEDLRIFVRGIERMGFKLTRKETSNKMFVMLEFVKSIDALDVTVDADADADPDPDPDADADADADQQEVLQLRLKPCIYKRR